MDGPAQIQAAAHALHALSKAWDGAHDLLEGGASGYNACLDVTVIPLDDVQFDVLLFQAALVPDGVQAVTLTLSGLARDFGSVKQWLTTSAQTACQAKRRIDALGGERLTTVRDDHRVITRDWLAADMNAMIAWMLRRTIRVLRSVDLSPDAVRADLFGPRQYQLALRAAVALLERAALLAVDCAAYVEEFNHRWSTLRVHLEAAKALYPLDDAARAARADPASFPSLDAEPFVDTPPAAWPVLGSVAKRAAMPHAA